MSFTDAICAGFRQYAEFGGRTSVAEFWWFILFVPLATCGLGALNVATPNGVIGVGLSLASVWVISTMVPTLAVSVRRLRDAGRRWNELPWLLIPIAGLIVMVPRMMERPSLSSGDAEVLHHHNMLVMLHGRKRRIEMMQEPAPCLVFGGSPETLGMVFPPLPFHQQQVSGWTLHAA